MMQLRLLGPFELRRIDGARVALPGRQSMAILACLGLAEGFSLARDRLADLVWAGRGEQADGSLRQELVRPQCGTDRHRRRTLSLRRQRFRRRLGSARALSRTLARRLSVAAERAARRMVRRASRASARHRAGADAAAPALGRGQPGARRAADWARSALRGGLPVPDPALRSGRRPRRRAAAIRGLRQRVLGGGARNLARNPRVNG